MLLTPIIAAAQTYQGMSEQDMQRMMQQAQEAQACMQNVDQSRLNALQSESQRVSKEIEALCAQGKRDAAQKRAMTFGTRMARDPSITEMRKCGEMMKGAMPEMPYTGIPEGKASGHVCD